MVGGQELFMQQLLCSFAIVTASIWYMPELELWKLGIVALIPIQYIY
jgi:hypothetical protein